MNSFAFVVDIPAEHSTELRELIGHVAADPTGLTDRARAVGYYREHMWIDTRSDGTARLVVNIDAPDGLSWATIGARLTEHTSAFTRWWDPRFGRILAASLGGKPPEVTQAVFAWDDPNHP